MTESSEIEPNGISLILAIFNEAESLPDVLPEAVEVLRLLKRPFEVLCINDGSTDGSATYLEAAAAGDFPEVRLVKFSKNYGQSAAFAAGFDAARFPWVITMDADGQNDPADIPRMLEEIGDADICCGYRAERKDVWSKRVGSLIGNGVRKRLLNSEVIDTGCSLKLFRSSALDGVPPWNGMHRFLPDLCQIYNQTQMVQIPVGHRPRLKGESKYTNGGRLLRTFPDLMAVRWMKKRMFRISALQIKEGKDAS